MHIEIYSKENCPHCVTAESIAQQICQESVNTYNKFKLNDDFTRDELLSKFPTARTFPQITIDGKTIGGLDDFIKYMQEL